LLRPLGRVVARFRAQTRPVLGAAGLVWQRDFFEHRLRLAESMESYGLYVFLNPYRAGLIAADQAWPHWHCPRPETFLFMSQLNPGAVPPCEWIGLPIPPSLAVGE